jgi:hypothetical protein
MQRRGGETSDESQNEPRPIIPSQATAQIDDARRRIEGIAARDEIDNESNLRINLDQMRTRRQNMQADVQERITRDTFIRKKQEHEENRRRGVNIPQLNGEQMRPIRNRLSELFKYEINPMMTKMILGRRGLRRVACIRRSAPGIHEVQREHIIQAIGRNPQRLYREKKRNPKLQTCTEHAAETLSSVQTIGRKARKLKDTSHEIMERVDVGARIDQEQGELESNVKEWRRQAKFAKKNGQKSEL